MIGLILAAAVSAGTWSPAECVPTTVAGPLPCSVVNPPWVPITATAVAAGNLALGAPPCGTPEAALWNACTNWQAIPQHQMITIPGEEPFEISPHPLDAGSGIPSCESLTRPFNPKVGCVARVAQSPAPVAVGVTLSTPNTTASVQELSDPGAFCVGARYVARQELEVGWFQAYPRGAPKNAALSLSEMLGVFDQTAHIFTLIDGSVVCNPDGTAQIRPFPRAGH